MLLTLNPQEVCEWSLSLRSKIRPTVLMANGEAGAGKTHLFKQLIKFYSEIEGYQLDDKYRLQINTESTSNEIVAYWRADELVRGLSPNSFGNAEQALMFAPIVQAFIRSHDEMMIVLIDEIDKAPAEVQTLFFAPFSEGEFNHPLVVSKFGKIVKCKPDNVLLYLTSNGFTELLGPMNRRIKEFILPFPDIQTMKYHIVPEMLAKEGILDDFSQEQINKSVRFMYQWRAKEPNHTMVQNQLVEIMKSAHYYHNADATTAKSKFSKVFMTMVAPKEADQMLLQTDFEFSREVGNFLSFS